MGRIRPATNELDSLVKERQMTTYNYRWFARDGEDFVIRDGTIDATDPEDAERRVMKF